MTDVKGELHKTIDDITDDVSRLKSVQQKSQGLSPGDPRTRTLADEAVQIAGQILPKTVKERKLAEEVSSD
jgi:hypothetical protein